MDGEVADYVASKEQNATPNSCDQQPPSTYFHLHTHGLTYTNPHSDTLHPSCRLSRSRERTDVETDVRRWIERGEKSDPPLQQVESESEIDSYDPVNIM